MEAIRDILARCGGTEFLPARSPLLVQIDPDNHLTIEDGGTSPHGLPVVALSFFKRDHGEDWHRRMLFEITDLGWLPFSLVSKRDQLALEAYRLDRRGRIKQTRRAVRRDLVMIAARWDEELSTLLPSGQITLT